MIALVGIAMVSCKNEKDENEVKITTEETVKVDTIGPKVRTETIVTETVETDSTETTITTGGVKVE